MCRITKTNTFSLEILSLTSSDGKKKVDLRAIFNELNVYADMDNIVLTGSVKVTEKGNLISSFPIIGKELIEVKFNSSSGAKKQYGDFHKVFFVYAVDSIQEYADTRSYVIRFTDVCALINNDIRLSIKFNDKPEEIISKVGNIINKDEAYKEAYSNFAIDNNLAYTLFDLKKMVSSQYDTKITVPNWKPFSLITYLANRAVSTDVNLAENNRFTDCLFFQQVDGKFVFTSYKQLFSTALQSGDGTEVKFLRQPSNLADASGNFIKYNIVNFNFNNMFNVQTQKATGLLGYTVFTADMLLKNQIESEVKYSDVFDIISQYKTVTTGDANKYFTIDYTQTPLYLEVVYNINSDPDEKEREKYVYPAVIKGNPVRQHLRSLTMTLELDGASDLDIGKYITVDLGKNPNTKVFTIGDYVKDTKWVISKIKHTITVSSYKTYVECFTPVLRKGK